jgi:hypothetical protein
MSCVGVALLEEQQVGADAGVGLEDAVGQTHDGVQVALFQQVFLQPRLDAFAEQRCRRADDGGAAAGLQQPDEQRQKQVGGFLGAEVLPGSWIRCRLPHARRKAGWSG